MVPEPLYWAMDPETTSHSYTVLLKFMPASWNWNSVLPVGTVLPDTYLETKPKVALPERDGLSVYAPRGDMIHPPPVTKPDFGSYTARSTQSLRLVLLAASVPYTQISLTSVVESGPSWALTFTV